MLSPTFPNNGKNLQHFPSLGITKSFLCIVIKNKQEKSCLLIDMSIPTEKNTSLTSLKVTEKLNIKTLKSKLKECGE